MTHHARKSDGWAKAPCMAHLFGAVAVCGLWSSPASSCVSLDGSAGSGGPPIFLVLFTLCMLFISVLACAIWWIQKRLFPRAAVFSFPVLEAGILALFLGLTDAFLIPQFMMAYEGLGADLPMPTIVVLAARHFLWAFVPWVIGLAYVVKARNVSKVYIYATLVVESLTLAIVYAALYAPGFKLGCMYEL